ncbi:MAG: hypothetical protein ACTHJK_13865 [Sphingomicrobium sp.]
MRRIDIVLLLACSACGVAPQPKNGRTVAAYEVPVPTAADRNQLLGLLSEEARAEGFHVDADTDEENRQLSEVSPLTINATVWRGKNDDEPIASVMDGADHLGLAWLTFAKSDEPERTAQFRQRVMNRIIVRWPKTQTLPIMPTGAIPLPQDLVLTNDGYRVKRSAASKYELPQSSPLATADTR